MQVSTIRKNQEDAGDDNFYQTRCYAKETLNLYNFLKQMI